MRTHSYEDRQNILVDFEELKAISYMFRGKIMKTKNEDDIKQYKENFKKIKEKVENDLSVKLQCIKIIDTFINE